MLYIHTQNIVGPHKNSLRYAYAQYKVQFDCVEKNILRFKYQPTYRIVGTIIIS